MKKTFILSLLSVMLFSVGTWAQTYRLTDMSEAEFEKGFNAHFRFDQYRLASGVYTPFTIYTDSGRVNYFDRYWPERFQGIPAGEQVVDVAAEKDYYMPLRYSWAAKKVNLEVGRDGLDPLSFLYISRIDQDTYETYPILRGQPAISFIAPEEGYYKITAKMERMDEISSGTVNYLMAKFRFRQQGTSEVANSSTLGMDVPYGVDTDPMDTYTAYAGTDYNGAERLYKKTPPVTNEFYVYIKSGDMITAESDISHFHGEGLFVDSTTYWARDAFGRTRWSQFDAERVTAEVAEASERFVNPYSDNDEYINLFKELFIECIEFTERVEIGLSVGQYNADDVAEFREILNTHGMAAHDPNLLGFTAKVYYERLLVQFEEFKAKAYTIDFQLPENRWLFKVPENGHLYADFEKQFLPSDDPGKAENSPWDFKTYTVSSGIYTNWENFGQGSSTAGTDQTAFYNKENDWLFIRKDGLVHPTTSVSPAITFTAAVDGVYHASTEVQRNTSNNNNNHMYTRYRFVKGGIEDGVTSIPKENYMFADAYGHPAEGNRPVSRDFYVSLKKGDVITFEEDAYTAGSNGSAGTDWEKLMVMLVPADQVETILNEYPELYYDPYAKATDFAEMDSVLNVVETYLTSVEGKVKEEPGLGEYPEAAKWEIDDALAVAQNLRNDPETTQVELNQGVLELSNAFTKFVASQAYRYESSETFTSGGYYIEKDGLFLTVDTFYSQNPSIARMYAHLEPMNDNSLKNNQVFNIQFNENPEYADPLRYTLTTCLKNETWDIDGEYHITEKGEIRLGDTDVAQHNYNNSNNHTWRNHSLLYNGEKWAIFNVHNKWSIVFNNQLDEFPTLVPTREYLYNLIPFGTPGVGVEKVGTDSDVTIEVYNTENGVRIRSTQPVQALIYNAAGQIATQLQLTSSAKTVTLPAGFYIIKASNGNTAKIMVK